MEYQVKDIRIGGKVGMPVKERVYTDEFITDFATDQ